MRKPLKTPFACIETMAKKKAAKKQAKVTKKPAKKPAKRKSVKRSPKAGSVETVKQPLLDVTAEVKESVVSVAPPSAQPAAATTMPEAESKKMHEEFTQSLQQEPPKRGFWSRLFGK
jgi:hypothetical protein